MKRALMYASVASMIQQFNMENIRLLLELGYEVDVACNMEQGSTITEDKVIAMKQELESMGVHVYHIPVPRKVAAIREIARAFSCSMRLMNDRKYDLVHCHSPIGGMICRLANRFSKGYKMTKMIYTAHGFHFYKGAPKISWLLFYPVEWVCARYTDVLITINQEDYVRAMEKLPAGEVVYVPGVGIDVENFSGTQIDRAAKRAELGVPEAAFLLCSVGELNANKNHEVVIRAMAELNRADMHYIIAGLGDKKEFLLQLAQELHLDDRVHLLGYRKDVSQLYKAADLFVFPSYREGLPVSVMEAMAAGLPLVSSRIRGNVDMIDENGGILCNPGNSNEFSAAIGKFINDPLLCKQAGLRNAAESKRFDKAEINGVMHKIYQSVTREE